MDHDAVSGSSSVVGLSRFDANPAQKVPLNLSVNPPFPDRGDRVDGGRGSELGG